MRKIDGQIYLSIGFLIFSCGDTKMLSITVAVVSVILVGKDIVGKKLSDGCQGVNIFFFILIVKL